MYRVKVTRWGDVPSYGNSSISRKTAQVSVESFTAQDWSILPGSSPAVLQIRMSNKKQHLIVLSSDIEISVDDI